jgi:hypothetical protein
MKSAAASPVLWQWVAQAALWGAGAMAILAWVVPVQKVYQQVAASPALAPRPIEATSFTGHMTKDGYWRVERDLKVNQQCQQVVIERIFRPANGPIFLLWGVRGNAFDGHAEPVFGFSRPTGTYDDQYIEYAPIAGYYGTHFVVVSPSGCERPIDRYVLYQLPFDWRGIKNPPKQPQPPAFQALDTSKVLPPAPPAVPKFSPHPGESP